MTGPVPDPLLRFVETPYAVAISYPDGELLIESNDSAFTQELAAHFRGTSSGAFPRDFEHIKVIVEHALTQGGEDLTRIDAELLHTLLRGTNTMLVHDSESRELLAFLAQDVSCEEFIERLLPAVAITNG